jgi:manganese/zinc/iron transport system substrate-binding protein
MIGKKTRFSHMRALMHRALHWSAVLLLLGGLAGCGPVDGGKRRRAEGPLRVVCTTGMITDAVRNVAGARVKVTGLMGPGIDPHVYKASEGDVARIAEADVLFYNGLHLEAKMADVFERMSDRVPTVALAESLEKSLLLSPDQFQGGYDPHVWFDVSLWIKVVGRVADELVRLDPPNATYYSENASRYVAELQALHDEVLHMAESIPAERRFVITAHDAFDYFGRAYKFGVRGLQGISTATEAGTADVDELATFIAQRKIPAIFIESSVPARAIQAVQAAVRAKGFEVEIGDQLYSDALGDPDSPAGTYVGMVRHNINAITRGLKGGR